jgi:hypothetical protein
MADGIYSGGLTIDRSGLPTHPIALIGTRRAILDAGGFQRTGIALHASHWMIQGITITNGLYGIFVRRGNHNLLDSLEIFHIGQEAVAIAVFSSDNVLRNSQIYDTGVLVAEWGEAVYIGTWAGHWDRVTGGLPDRSDRNQIVDNVLGPDVRSEHVDVKEGTTGGLIKGNRFNGAGMVQSQFWVDSWVEIKGNNYVISDNTGNMAITDGFQVFSVISGWGNNNVFRRNLVDLRAPGFGFSIRGGTGNLVGCDNVVTSAGAGLASLACVELP